MRNRVIVPDGEYIIKSENSIGNAPKEWTPLVRCRDCKHMDADELISRINDGTLHSVLPMKEVKE